MPPKDKNVEQRKQTQQKLELMELYWAAWTSILAQSKSPWFCARWLWLVDTMAGSGLHESASDPDGARPGTPMQAVFAAQDAQRRFPSVVVKVRASDINKVYATRLDRLLDPYRGDPPEFVDVRVEPRDWVETVPAILAEIADGSDHRFANPRGHADHHHRSLWFIDPYGWQPIDRKVIESLPVGAEVIVNLDLTSITRHAGRSDPELRDRLDGLFDGDGWTRVPGEGQAYRERLAQLWTDSFRTHFKFREPHPLRPSGGQDRFMVHLANNEKAATEFKKHVSTSLRRGTVIAGASLDHTKKDIAAKALWERFKGRTLTTDEMYSVDASFTRGQLRTICHAADIDRYGRWNASTKAMEWFEERGPLPNLGL